MKRILVTVGVLAIVYLGTQFVGTDTTDTTLTTRASSQSRPATSSHSTPSPAANVITRDPIADAFASHRSNIEVTGSGTVVRVLADDRNGSPHQRFILRLPSGQTVLIAHNIVLAHAIAGLKPGDAVQFKGEYEWNQQGGVVHWTHADPDGRHEAGWLKHNGHTYR